MSERQKQADFLKALLACDDCPTHRDLHERLVTAERDERSMKRAFRLVVVVTMVALATLGYLTVLEVSDSMGRLAAVTMRFSQALALGSAMCSGVFVAMLFWQRALIRRLHAEGRGLVALQLQNRSRTVAAPLPTIIVHEGDTAVYHIGTRAHSGGTSEIVMLPKAS